MTQEMRLTELTGIGSKKAADWQQQLTRVLEQCAAMGDIERFCGEVVANTRPKG